MPDVTTSADLRAVIDDLLPRLGAITDADWDRPAHHLEWTCRETVAHVMDDFVYYAMQLAGRHPPQADYVVLDELPPERDGAPSLLIRPSRSSGTAGIVEVLDASAGLLEAVTATAPHDRRGYHPGGLADASAFAAMGVTEAVLHAWDMLTAQGQDYRAEAEVCRRVLNRLFPATARTDDPWQDLLAASGRTEETRGIDWMWDSSVRDDYGPGTNAASSVGEAGPSASGPSASGSSASGAAASGVTELRVALTVPDLDAALAFYRDALGMPLVDAWLTADGNGYLLSAGRGTLELIDEPQAQHIDQVEVGRRVAGAVRLALEVPDSAAAAGALERLGATALGPPTITPWGDRNARVAAPEGTQLTLFTPTGEAAGSPGPDSSGV
jgi:catechol 2,3-dioxygenase-like lactoylglutathione lyase family enzyme